VKELQFTNATYKYWWIYYNSSYSATLAEMVLQNLSPAYLTVTPNGQSNMNVVTNTYGSDVTFTITNTGQLTSSIISFSLSNTANFEFHGGTLTSGVSTLAGGSSGTIIVRPKATSDVSYIGNLVVTSNNTQTVALSGSSSNTAWAAYTGAYDGSWLDVTDSGDSYPNQIQMVGAYPNAYAGSGDATFAILSGGNGATGSYSGALKVEISGTSVTKIGNWYHTKSPAVGEAIGIASPTFAWQGTAVGSPYNHYPVGITIDNTGVTSSSIANSAFTSNGGFMKIHNLDSTRAIAFDVNNNGGVQAMILNRTGNTVNSNGAIFTIRAVNTGAVGTYGDLGTLNSTTSVSAYHDALTSTGPMKLMLMSHASSTISSVTVIDPTISVDNGSIYMSDPLDGFGNTASRFMVTWSYNNLVFGMIIKVTDSTITHGTPSQLFAGTGVNWGPYYVKYSSPGVVLGLVTNTTGLNITQLAAMYYNSNDVNDLSMSPTTTLIAVTNGGNTNLRLNDYCRLSDERILIAAHNNGVVGSFVKVLSITAPAILTPSSTNITNTDIVNSSPGSDVTITITNTGQSTSAIINFSLTNTTNFEFNGGTLVNGVSTLAKNASGTIIVRPKATSNGAYSGNLIVTSNNTQTIALSGTASGLSYTVSNSLRLFYPSQTAWLENTPSTNGSNTKFAVSFWAKKANNGSYQAIFSTDGDPTDYDDTIAFGAANKIQINYYFGMGNAINLSTIRSDFNDLNKWYHICLIVNTNEPTQTDRVKFYVDGAQITSFETSGYAYVYPSLGQACGNMNQTRIRYWGRQQYWGAYFGGYLAECYIVDNQTVSINDFGIDIGGIWKPKKYNGPYGTNGCYLEFKNSGNLGLDSAGIANWTLNNITSSNSSIDVPS
jgi:hypothetical protein